MKFAFTPARASLNRAAKTCLLLASSMLCASGVMAQTRAALVRNVDEPGHQPYELTVEFKNTECFRNCTSVTFGNLVSLVTGPAIPAGKRFIVLSISAMLAAYNSINSVSLQTAPLAANQNVKWQSFGPFFGVPIQGAYPMYGMSSPAYTTIEPGEPLYIRVSYNSPGAGFLVNNVTLSGYLIDVN